MYLKKTKVTIRFRLSTTKKKKYYKVSLLTQKQKKTKQNKKKTKKQKPKKKKKKQKTKNKKKKSKNTRSTISLWFKLQSTAKKYLFYFHSDKVT